MYLMWCFCCQCICLLPCISGDLDEGLSDEEEKDDEGGLGNEKEGSEKIQTPGKSDTKI